MQAKKYPGFPAKWNCWDQFGPGVAPSEGQLEKSKRNWQRQKSHFVVGAWKTSISRPFFIVKTMFTPQQTRNKLLNKTCLLLRGATSNPI